MADGAYQINPNAVMSITADVSSLASHTSSLTSELTSMSLDATAFGSIGSAVASANSALQNQILQNLTALTQLIEQTNQSVATSAQNYVAADTAVAQAFGGGQAVTPVSTAGGYSYTYPLPNTAGMSPEQVWCDVSSHLNQLFPLANVPSSIHVGDVMHLQIPTAPGLPGIGDAPVQVTDVGNNGFSFVSLPGHAEGAGRTISFTMAPQPDGTVGLQVDAGGPVSGWSALPGNDQFTHALWSVFANNINGSESGTFVGGGGDSGGAGASATM